MKKIFALATIAMLAACATSTSSDDPTADNIQTACGWITLADVGFSTANAVSPGSFSPSIVSDVQKAEAAANVICTPPYPTDAETAVADLLKILAQIQTATPAS